MFFVNSNKAIGFLYFIVFLILITSLLLSILSLNTALNFPNNGLFTYKNFLIYLSLINVSTKKVGYIKSLDTGSNSND